MTHKIIGAAFGIVAGIASIPLIAIVWPVFVTWFFYNEIED